MVRFTFLTTSNTTIFCMILVPLLPCLSRQHQGKLCPKRIHLWKLRPQTQQTLNPKGFYTRYLHVLNIALYNLGGPPTPFRVCVNIIFHFNPTSNSNPAPHPQSHSTPRKAGTTQKKVATTGGGVVFGMGSVAASWNTPLKPFGHP